MNMQIKFSVIMPTFNHSSFIRRAIISLLNQSCDEWELIIIDDGSTDNTQDNISDFLINDKISYIKLSDNHGLGYALNMGLRAAKYKYIAYLPSDDYFFENHLSTIKNTFSISESISFVYTGLKYDDRDSLHSGSDIETKGVRPGFCLQLVQVAHRKTDEFWVERDKWISDDLFAMYWRKLLKYGDFVNTNMITAYWTQHPFQRHKLINEKFNGGLNKVRSYYGIKHPIKIKVSKSKFIDENSLYEDFRNLKVKECNNKIKILIVGELAYNPERICALEEAGYELYALWMPFPNLSFSTVGPLPFGNVKDIDINNWRDEVARLKPDMIYGLLNWGDVSWVYKVVKEFPEIPLAWHFKEGPHLVMSNGDWNKLIYLYEHASLKIFLNEEVRKWFGLFIKDKGLSMVMDGDLPKKEYFKENFSDKLSLKDGETHVLCAGRLIGIGSEELCLFSKEKIHIHLYLENFHASSANLMMYYKRTFPDIFHLHNHCTASHWTEEFSKYDAGWLHCHTSCNGGDLMRASWDDLNIPARISTYASAGIPIIQKSNKGNIVAVENCLKNFDIGLLYTDMQDLVNKLKNKEVLVKLSENVLKYRNHFNFDYYIPELARCISKIIRK